MTPMTPGRRQEIDRFTDACRGGHQCGGPHAHRHQMHADELRHEVDRLTSDLAAAHAEIDRLRDGWEGMP